MGYAPWHRPPSIPNRWPSVSLCRLKLDDLAPRCLASLRFLTAARRAIGHLEKGSDKLDEPKNRSSTCATTTYIDNQRRRGSRHRGPDDGSFAGYHCRARRRRTERDPSEPRPCARPAAQRLSHRALRPRLVDASQACRAPSWVSGGGYAVWIPIVKLRCPASR